MKIYWKIVNSAWIIIQTTKTCKLYGFYRLLLFRYIWTHSLGTILNVYTNLKNWLRKVYYYVIISGVFKMGTVLNQSVNTDHT